MLTRNDQLASPEKILSDTLTHKPAVSSSVWNNFAMGTSTPNYAINSLDQEYRQSPRGRSVQAMFDAINRGNENPEVGWGQWGANEVANMVGQALNPSTWAFGEVGGLALKPLIGVASKVAPAFIKKPIAQLMAEPIAKYIPEMIGKKGEEKALSIGLFGEEMAKGFGVVAGASLPQATIDNFNRETNSFDLAGMAKEMGYGGMFGMSIAVVPFAWGILKSNINRARSKAPSAPIEVGDAEKALEAGVINKDTYDYWKELEAHRESPTVNEALKTKSTKYIASQGHSVDYANDLAHFEILNREQMQNFQSATIDQLLSDHIPEEHRTALTDFTMLSGLDDMRNKVNLLDGVRGYVQYADERLGKRDEVLAKADKLVDEHISMQEKDARFPLDQQSIYDALKQHGETTQLPFTVPDSVTKRMADERKGNKKLSPILSPVDELKQLKESLLNNKDKELSKDYQRLKELAEVWEPAKTLLHRVHLEDNIKKQEGYRDLAKMMLDVADSNAGRMADIDKVKSYLEARTKQRIDDNSKPKVLEKELDKSYQVPVDSETIIAEQDRMMEKVNGNMVKEEYELAKDKFDDFKKSENIFKNFINCVLGASS